MKTTILSKEFSSFTSYSLVINGQVTNFWDTDKTVIDRFKDVFDNSSELQKIAKDCLSKDKSFDICSFIPVDYFKDLPIKIIHIYNVYDYWKFEKEHKIEEIFSISGNPTNRDEITENFVKSKVYDNNLNQLNRLYTKTGERAKELICFVFNYGYHFSTLFN